MHVKYETIICTYNGEAYIEAQLCSILQQSPPPIAIWVSDDGSTDKTEQIVTSTGRQSTVPIHWVRGPGQGIVKNVFSALRKTVADYVFLADQDDIWLENKVAIFSEEMYSAEDERTKFPHLIFSDAWVWHPQSEKRKSFWMANNINPSNANMLSHTAFYNSVQGASSCVNRAMIDCIKDHDAIIMHDWWMALIAASFGSITHIDEPTMLYRQHRSNLVGSSKPRLKKLMAAKNNISRSARQLEAFRSHYLDKLSDDKRDFFTDFHKSVKKGGISRMSFISKHKIKHKTLPKTLMLWAGYLTK
ncbi:glycosyltransferase family 2 protein [Marinimicrobium alkaliphilum]|uniref:glycosyltransferase family 2 protein n=1 Tax=Marinimicrobium alkaliphilum TaxID=2202654 RepID=UPI000DB9F8DD|nr:glycosyltransferase family 2 protein [Marinimicrobium alkaliphilum]